jgi:hypothetical protein
VVECTALEMRHRCKPIGGSNPSLSAKPPCASHPAAIARGTPAVRFRVAVYPGAEPSETRRLVLSDRRISPGDDVPEAFFGYRNPNAPNQTLETGGHSYLQTTPNRVFGIVNDADLISELGSGGAFGFGESKPVTRRGVQMKGVDVAGFATRPSQSLRLAKARDVASVANPKPRNGSR